MKLFEYSGANRPRSHWGKLIAVSLLAVALAGCGGGGSDGAAGAPGAKGDTGAAGAPGTNGKDANSVVRIASNTAPADAAAAANWKALAPQVTITSVTVPADTKPVVKFTVKDAAGNPVVGLGNVSKSATAIAPSLSNVAFTIAKLVPGVGTTPSKWVSYNVTTVPLAATPTVVAGTFPATDAAGTLVDNGDGTYQYTFYRDLDGAAARVAGLTDNAAAFSYKADLGDVSYQRTFTHRVGIQIGGAAPGTGSNVVTPGTFLPVTPTNANPVSVSMVNTGNAVIDFRPDGGTVANTRKVVKLESCSDCHHGKVLAHGSRKDPNYCVTCHTDQIRYSFSQEASTVAGDPYTLNGSTRPTTAVVDGRALGNFPNMVHKIHMGAELVKQGYNYNASAEGQFNEVKFPQDLRNCTKCHDNSAAAVNPTPDGNNWHRVPSPLACGACHDGIKFDSTSGKTLGGANTGHGGVNLVGPADASDPAKCSSCHTSDGIQFVHTPVTPPNPANSLLLGGTNTNTNAASIASNTARLPAGAIKVTYDIQSVSRNASKQPVMVFRMLQDGVAVPFQTYAAGVTTEIWNHFFGAPSVYFVFAVPQDGVAKPADFNASASGYLRSIWNGTATGTGAGTLTGPDASGYYKATLTGVQVPDSAVMLTGGLGYSYNVTSSLPLTQDNVNGYPASAATATTGLNATMPNKIGGLIVIAPDAQKVATGYTARRAIIDDAKCNKCHQELGAFTAEAFHAGQRNDGSTCSWCHTPNRASSGWSADSTNFVHAIHGNSKRAVDFTWHAASITDGLWKVGYPGVLKNCSACHLPGTYNFGATASASAVPNRLYRTVATGKFNGTSADPVANFALSPYVVKDNVYNYGAGFAFNASATAASNITKADGTVFSNPAQGVFNAEGTTLVDSPISTVCFACHDSAAARGHIELNGGSIYAARSTALGKAEQCVVCHAAGKEQDIEALHAK